MHGTHSTQLLSEAVVDLPVSVPQSILHIFAKSELKVLQYEGFTLYAVSMRSQDRVMQRGTGNVLGELKVNVSECRILLR